MNVHLERSPAASKRVRQRAERIRENVDMGDLMAEYGYDIVPGASQEQQFRCDLHGQDNKPSARYYPDTNSTYCWACQMARDPIRFLMDKEGVTFSAACNFLEKRAGLPPLPWDDEDAEIQEQVQSFLEEFTAELDSYEKETFGTLFYRIDRLLLMAKAEGELPMERILIYADNLDKVRYLVRKKKKVPEPKGIEALFRIEKRLKEDLREQRSARSTP